MIDPKIYILNHVPDAFKTDDHWMHPEREKMTPAPSGQYVRYEDYARLKAEVERLTAFTTRTIIPNEELQTENARLKVEVKHLSKNDKKWYEFCVKIMDKVERLTKAGDAIAEIFANERACDNDCSVSDLYEFHSLLKEWKAAKEGKGQP